jgi:hypothetical protein
VQRKYLFICKHSFLIFSLAFILLFSFAFILLVLFSYFLLDLFFWYYSPIFFCLYSSGTILLFSFAFILLVLFSYFLLPLFFYLVPRKPHRKTVRLVEGLKNFQVCFATNLIYLVRGFSWFGINFQYASGQWAELFSKSVIISIFWLRKIEVLHYQLLL